MADTYGRTSRTFRRLRLRVLEESSICWLCGQSGADTVDHVVPLSIAPDLGEELANLRPAHGTCNSSRGNRPPQSVQAMPSSRRW